MRNVFRWLLAGGVTLAAVSAAFGQGAPAPPAPAPTAPTTTAPTTTTPTTTTPGPGRGGIGTSTPNFPTQAPRPIFISGRVLMHDGGELPERVTIERLCSTNSVRSEGYTDSKGYFAFQLGQGLMALPDASTQFTFDANNPNGMTNSPANNGNSGLGSRPDNVFWDCELRARLPGYRSTNIVLAGRKPMDNPDVGQIVLFPIGAVEGRAVSMTNAQAPKDAKKAYEKGLNAAKKNKREEAEKEFRKSVEIYPKYAEAWMELGKLFIGREQFVQAREALDQAVAADPRYVFPYEQLYAIAFQEAKWQELADTTNRLLRLNPYDFIGAYYYNGVAHYQMQHFEDAEKSLREALGMDFRNQNPKTRYVLALVLVQQKNYTEATEHLKAFVKLAPEDPIISKVKSILQELDKVQQAQALPPVPLDQR